MSRGLKLSAERMLVAMLILLFFGSTGWSIWARRDFRRVHANSVSARFAQSAYQQTEWATTVSESQPWRKPTPQSAGGKWLYELFTPPAVFFDPSTKQFAVTPPDEERKTGEVFALELIAVRRELYRLQLSGYFGEPNAYTAAFSWPGNPGSFFAKAGDHLHEPAVTLIRFHIQGGTSSGGDPGTADKIAWAELRDDRTGQTVTLNNREPTYTDTPVATVRLNSKNDSLREVRMGDVVTDENLVYRIGRVTYSPAEVTVSCEEPRTARIEHKIPGPVDADWRTTASPPSHTVVLYPRLATGFSTPEK